MKNTVTQFIGVSKSYICNLYPDPEKVEKFIRNNDKGVDGYLTQNWKYGILLSS